ncbi:MAG: 50S ribosomal protein L24 [Candidatus Nanopelagicales bacterium]|nr:50S ribosomal protein L24 [Candidatus Nanopelagicales bacterium]
MKIRQGDTVQVITGKDKGLQGKVIKSIPAKRRVIVEGVNRVTRHTKTGQGLRGAKSGGIVVQEASIDVSNVMVVDSDGKPTRVRKQRESVDKSRRDGTTYSGTRGKRVSARNEKDL